MARKKIEVAQIQRRPDLQPRDKLNSDRVAQLVEAIKEGKELPAVTVFSVNGDLLLTEGFHRTEAHVKAKQEKILANIRQGTLTDARWNAATSNKDHDTVGLYRSNKDKRRAVQIALEAVAEMDEDKRLSNVQVAKRLGVSEGLVRKVLRENEDIVLYEISPDGGAAVEEKIRELEEIEEEVEDVEEDYELSSEPVPLKQTAKFNQTNDMVDWARWTWNPVTGCEHGCTYCYARDIACRFYAEKFEPTFHEERLSAPHSTKLPEAVKDEEDPIHKTAWRNVFVCSMADLFGNWVPIEWIKDVFIACEQNQNWNYLFLTKNPGRYTRLTFPPTAWVGTTVDTQARVKKAEQAFQKIDASVKWLSCEPMKEHLKFKRLDLFDWVVVGGQSANSIESEFTPDPSWVSEFVHAAKEAGCAVYMKLNTFIRPSAFKEYGLRNEQREDFNEEYGRWRIMEYPSQMRKS